MVENFLDTATAGNKNRAARQQPEQSLARVEPQVPDNSVVSPALQTARLLFDSGLFPSAQNIAGVFTIVQFGEEIGLSPVVALNNVAIIKGRLSMSGASMLALSFKYGVKADYLEESESRCAINFTREGFPDYISTFTYIDAEKAGLLDKNDKGEIKSDIWRKYLKTMLKWRAVSQGMKMIAPDILAGVYTPEEIDNIEVVNSAQNHTPSNAEEARQMEFDFHSDVNDPVGDPVDESSTRQVNDLVTEIQSESQTASEKAVEKVTAPQLKKLHVMATQSGLQSFMSIFKVWLVNIEDSGLPAENPSGKDLNKDFCSKLISSFEKFSTLFFASPSTRAGIKDVFSSLKEEEQRKILKTIASYLDDMSSVGEISIDKAEFETLCHYLNLFLVTLENQEHNKIADGGKKKGLTVDQVLETLRELGFNPEVQERIELNTKEDKKPVEEPPMDDFNF
jgi:hypothetical protein